MTLHLNEPRPLITKEMILKKFMCIEDFADAAKMTRQNVYLIINNPKYGYRKDTKKTMQKLLKLLGAGQHGKRK